MPSRPDSLPGERKGDGVADLRSGTPSAPMLPIDTSSTHLEVYGSHDDASSELPASPGGNPVSLRATDPGNRHIPASQSGASRIRQAGDDPPLERSPSGGNRRLDPRPPGPVAGPDGQPAPDPGPDLPVRGGGGVSPGIPIHVPPGRSVGEIARSGPRTAPAEPTPHGGGDREGPRDA